MTDQEQIAALLARMRELEQLNAGLCSDHNALLADGARWQSRAETAEATVRELEQARDRLTAACQAALDWQGLDGDHITDPTRTVLLAALAARDAAGGARPQDTTKDHEP